MAQEQSIQSKQSRYLGIIFNFVSNNKTMDILFKRFSHLNYLYVQSVQILYHIFMRRLIIWMFNTDLSRIMIYNCLFILLINVFIMCQPPVYVAAKSNVLITH